MADHAPLTGRQAARLGVASTAADIIDILVSAIPTARDRDLAPGDWLRFDRKIASLRVELFHRCITLELARGTTWAVIAERLDISEDAARQQFGHCDLTHLSGQEVWDVLGETDTTPVPELRPPTPEDAARELDDRCRVWQQHPGEHAGPSGRPVTDHL